MGNQLVAEAIIHPGQTRFKAQPLANSTLDGVVSGTFKTEGNLTFSCVLGAGHEVLIDNPKVALQVFEQTMRAKRLSST